MHRDFPSDLIPLTTPQRSKCVCEAVLFSRDLGEVELIEFGSQAFGQVEVCIHPFVFCFVVAAVLARDELGVAKGS